MAQYVSRFMKECLEENREKLEERRDRVKLEEEQDLSCFPLETDQQQSWLNACKQLRVGCHLYPTGNPFRHT